MKVADDRSGTYCSDAVPQVRKLFVQRSRLVYNEGQIVRREVKLKLLGRGRVGLKQIPT